MVLFQAIAAIVLLIPIGIAMSMSGGEPGGVVIAAALPLVAFGLAVLIPGIALYLRRLHDQNLTGWIYLGLIVAILIPIIGLLSLVAYFVFACIPGNKDLTNMVPTRMAMTRRLRLASRVK